MFDLFQEMRQKKSIDYKQNLKMKFEVSEKEMKNMKHLLKK